MNRQLLLRLLTSASGLKRQLQREIDNRYEEKFPNRSLCLHQLPLRHQSRHRDQLPPQTRWLELPGCGHVPTHDDPALVAEVILGGSAFPEGPQSAPPHAHKSS